MLHLVNWQPSTVDKKKKGVKETQGGYQDKSIRLDKLNLLDLTPKCQCH